MSLSLIFVLDWSFVWPLVHTNVVFDWSFLLTFVQTVDDWAELEAIDYDAKGTTLRADEPANTDRTRSPKKPHDDNLINLSLLQPEPRYINASRFKLDDCKVPIVATQAPLHPESYGNVDTRGDFWELVLQDEVEVVVCLTNVDHGRNGCPQYWPGKGVNDSIVLNNGINVRLLHEKETTSFTARIIQLTVNEKPGLFRMVRHFQFREWPDYGVPASVEPLLQLMGAVEEAHQPQFSPTPLLVHCSAGHGRTGCFVAIYSRLVASLGAETLKATVKQLRVQRNSWVVQAKIQYDFCGDVIVAGNKLERKPMDTLLAAEFGSTPKDHKRQRHWWALFEAKKAVFVHIPKTAGTTTVRHQSRNKNSSINTNVFTDIKSFISNLKKEALVYGMPAPPYSFTQHLTARRLQLQNPLKFRDYLVSLKIYKCMHMRHIYKEMIVIIHSRCSGFCDG